MRVLLIDENEKTSTRTLLALKGGGFNVYATAEGEEGVQLANLYPYDLVIVSTSVVDLPGIEVVRMIRRRHLPVSIMACSTSTSHAEEVLYFNSGADDYVPKLMVADALAARTRAIIRRSYGHPSSMIEIGPLLLNLNDKELSVADERVALTKREYALFELLVLRIGRVVHSEVIFDHLYGGLDEPDLKVLDVFVCKLRKKLFEATGGLEFVETIWGEGYRIYKTPLVRTESVA